MSWGEFCGDALLLTIECGVAGVTNLRGLVCIRQWELGFIGTTRR
jgi:hypothetical protein